MAKFYSYAIYAKVSKQSKKEKKMNKKIAFIGAGNMALSLINGLIASGYDKNKIIATDPKKEQRDNITQTIGIKCFASNADAVNQAEIIVLAVKPQVLNSVCTEIKHGIEKTQPLVISIAAGVRSTDINLWLGGHTSIVRCMPNTPSMIQAGATGLFATKSVSNQQKSDAENILRAVGISVWVDSDEDLDSVTALSGSGPAYYFLFMEAMQATAEQMGLSASAAKLLTIQTAFGAAKMALESPYDCKTLRKKVTSPNGTTEKAIQSFEDNNLRKIVEQAMLSAKNRAISLADELSIPIKIDSK